MKTRINNLGLTIVELSIAIGTSSVVVIAVMAMFRVLVRGEKFGRQEKDFNTLASLVFSRAQNPLSCSQFNPSFSLKMPPTSLPSSTLPGLAPLVSSIPWGQTGAFPIAFYPESLKSSPSAPLIPIQGLEIDGVYFQLQIKLAPGTTGPSNCPYSATLPANSSLPSPCFGILQLVMVKPNFNQNSSVRLGATGMVEEIAGLNFYADSSSIDFYPCVPVKPNLGWAAANPPVPVPLSNYLPDPSNQQPILPTGINHVGGGIHGGTLPSIPLPQVANYPTQLGEIFCRPGQYLSGLKAHTNLDFHYVGFNSTLIYSINLPPGNFPNTLECRDVQK